MTQPGLFRSLPLRVAGSQRGAAHPRGAGAAAMNLFRLAGDMAHLFSLVVRTLGRAPPAPRVRSAGRRLTHVRTALAAAGAAAEDSSHQELCRCDSRPPAGETPAACAAETCGVPHGAEPASRVAVRCAAHRHRNEASWHTARPLRRRRPRASQPPALRDGGVCASRSVAWFRRRVAAHAGAVRARVHVPLLGPVLLLHLAVRAPSCDAAPRTRARLTRARGAQLQHGDEADFHHRHVLNHLVHAEAPRRQPDVQQGGGHLQDRVPHRTRRAPCLAGEPRAVADGGARTRCGAAGPRRAADARSTRRRFSGRSPSTWRRWPSCLSWRVRVRGLRGLRWR